MKTVSVVDAQKRLTDLIGDLKEGPVVPLSKGRPCAALVGLDEHVDRESFHWGGTRRCVGCWTWRAGEPKRRVEFRSPKSSRKSTSSNGAARASPFFPGP